MIRSLHLGGFLFLGAVVAAQGGGATVPGNPGPLAPGVTTASARPAGAAPGSPDARLLGVTEAVLSYCAKNDPIGAAKVHARLKRLTHGASKESLAEVRLSHEYQAARDSELKFVDMVDPRNAKRLCSDLPDRKS